MQAESLSARPAVPQHLLAGVRYEFLEELRSLRRSPRTIKWYDETLSAQHSWILDHEGVGHLESLTRVSLIHFMADLADRNLSPAYMDSHYRGMRAFFNWCQNTDYDLHSSLYDKRGRFNIRKPEVPKREKPRYSPEKLEAIFEAITTRDTKGNNGERDRVLVATFLGSGCRLAEIAGLTEDAISVDPQEGNSFLHVLGKGNKWRWVPISTKLRRELERYIHRQRPASHSSNIFLQANGEPLSARGIQEILKRVRKAAGFRLHAHAFRHHYGSHYAAQEGASPARLQKIMGHESITTTMGSYVTLNRRDLASDVERMSPL